MDDAVAVQVIQPDDEVGDEEFGLQLCESSPPADVVPQIAAVDVVHDQVEVLPILEGAVHVDEEGVPDPGQQVALVHD